MRFIHLADVHLGAVPDRGCPWSKEREEEIWNTFRRVIAGIRQDPVDLLFISGDLFHRQPLMRELKEVNYLFSTIPDTRYILWPETMILSAGILFIIHLNGIPTSHSLRTESLLTLKIRNWMFMYTDSAIMTGK